MPIETISDVYAGSPGLVLIIALSTITWIAWKSRQWLSQKLTHCWLFAAKFRPQQTPMATRVVESTDENAALLVQEMETLRHQLAERSRHLHVLYQVTEQLNQESDLAGVIGVTLESLWRAVALDFVAVVLGDDELGPFHYAGVRGVEDPLSVLGQECELPLWGTLAHALVHHPPNGEPDYLVVHDIEAEARPAPREFPWDAEKGSMMIIPMRQSGRTVGAFLLGSRHCHHFAPEPSRHFVYAIAGTAARAIQEAQTRRQSVRWLKQLVSLQSFTHTITRTSDLNTIVNVLYSELTDLFGEADVRVFLNRSASIQRAQSDSRLVDERRLYLYTPEPILGVEAEQMAPDDLPALVHWVMEAEQPLFFEPTSHPDDITDFYYRSSGRGLMVPIGEEKPNGVIYLSAPERATPFEEGDLIVVRTISNSIAIALGAIELYEQVNSDRNAAVVRPRTGSNDHSNNSSDDGYADDGYSGVT